LGRRRRSGCCAAAGQLVKPAGLALESAAQSRGDPAGLVGVDLGEEVHISGRPVGEAVRDHGAAAGEGQGVCLWQAQCGTGDAVLQRIEGH